MSNLVSLNSMSVNDELNLSVNHGEFVEDIEQPKITSRHRRLRALLLEALYLSFISDRSFADSLEHLLQAQAKPMPVTMVQLINKIAMHIDSDFNRINAQLSKLMARDSLENTALIDRCILTMTVAELEVNHDLLPAIIINEAVELARIYGSDNSVGFVNGVMRAFTSSHTTI